MVMQNFFPDSPHTIPSAPAGLEPVLAYRWRSTYVSGVADLGLTGEQARVVADRAVKKAQKFIEREVEERAGIEEGEKGGPGSGWYGPPRGTHGPGSQGGQKVHSHAWGDNPRPVLRTKLDWPKGFVPNKHDVTRWDDDAIISLDLLRDPKRVDLVRTAGEPLRGTRFEGGEYSYESYTPEHRELAIGEESRRIHDLMTAMGKDGQTTPITVAVEQDGSITFIDGTHRAAAAALLGWDSLWGEVRYFGGSDRDHLIDYLNAEKEKSLHRTAIIIAKRDLGNGLYEYIYGIEGEE